MFFFKTKKKKIDYVFLLNLKVLSSGSDKNDYFFKV